MSEPRNPFPDVVRLRDGAEIVVRPIRPDDKDAIVAGFESLSPESRYRRFFSPLQKLTRRDLAYLTEVDHHDHEALIGFDAESREPVGVARFIRADEPAEAEVAVVVVDHWQRRGVGTALLERLVERARQESIERFVALVLSDNREVVDLFQSLAPDRESRTSASGNLELVIELPEAGAAVPGTLLGRALRAAAHGALVANPWRVIRERIAR